MRRLILIGPSGYGKSTTGNTLLKEDCFTTGNDTLFLTREIKFKEIDELLVVDCPGFGSALDYTCFHTEFLKYKNKFLEATPINAFILVLKFDNKESNAFIEAARQFCRSFSAVGIKSLMLLCIQGNNKIRYSQDDFENIIKDADGYRFLKMKNEDIDIPYCLWDNIRPYFKQEKMFEKILDALPQYTRQMMKLAFEMIERELEKLNKEF